MSCTCIVSHVPRIAVTAYARTEQIDYAKSAGVVETHDLTTIL